MGCNRRNSVNLDYFQGGGYVLFYRSQKSSHNKFAAEVLLSITGAFRLLPDPQRSKYPDLSMAALYSLSCFSKVCHLKQNLTEDAAFSESRHTISVHARRECMYVLP